jgi:hypothetical protein
VSDGEPQATDSAELTDADLEAIAAGKQRMGRFVGDVIITAPMVKVGLLPRWAYQSRAFRRSAE